MNICEAGMGGGGGGGVGGKVGMLTFWRYFYQIHHPGNRKMGQIRLDHLILEGCHFRGHTDQFIVFK